MLQFGTEVVMIMGKLLEPSEVLEETETNLGNKSIATLTCLKQLVASLLFNKLSSRYFKNTHLEDNSILLRIT